MWLSVDGSEVEKYRVQPGVCDGHGSHACIWIPRILLRLINSAGISEREMEDRHVQTTELVGNREFSGVLTISLFNGGWVRSSIEDR